MHGTGAVKFRLALLGCLMLHPASAEQKNDCGTIVMPTGAGQTESDVITSFSPIYSDSQYNEEAGWLMYPSLLWINRFSQIDWSRSLATAVTTSDNTNFLITMRPWHWSDGVPVTAGDVAYSFALDKGLGPDWVDYGQGGLPYIVKSLKVLSATQLVITTTHAVNPTWFIYNAISGLAPLPEHAWKKYTLDQMYQLQTTPSFYDVVDGPLKLQRFDVGLDAVFVPNPAWEGPKMHFTRLVFNFIQGDGVAVQGVEAGDLDEGALPTDLYASIHNHPGLYTVILRQSHAENVIAINFKNPNVAFFRDVRVRQAMIDAIDQVGINRGLEHGAGDPGYGPVPRSYTQFLSPQMQAGSYPVGYDPANAKALLAAAGYTPGRDGIMVKDGKRLAFTYLEESGTDAIVELDEIIAAQLRDVGIEMKIRVMDFNQILAVMAGPADGWQATGVGQPINNYPSGEGSYQTGAFQNFGGYSDPKMDSLINENINKPGLAPLFAYETYVAQQQPVIFGPRERSVILVNNRLHGIAEFIDPVGMYAPDQLYCTAPEQEAAK